MEVSLVRVESEWHVFEDRRDAWAFYVEWREYRECECLVDAHVTTRSEVEVSHVG